MFSKGTYEGGALSIEPPEKVPPEGVPIKNRKLDIVQNCDSYTAIICLMELILILCDIVRCEVFTAVTMKNGVFWDVTPCGSCKN
jgi:hypothetical protein